MKTATLITLIAAFGGCAQASADVFDTIKPEAKARVAFRFPGRPAPVYLNDALGYRTPNGDPWLCGEGHVVHNDDDFVDHFRFIASGSEFFISLDYPQDQQAFNVVWDAHCPQRGWVRLVKMD